MAFLFSSRFLNTSALTRQVLVGNRLIWMAAGALVVLQMIFIYTPFMNSWFGSAPIGWRSWLLVLVLAFLTFLFVEAVKAISRKLEKTP